MAARVAINGFGRIGKAIFRKLVQDENPDIELVLINSLGSIEVNSHLLKYDSISRPATIDGIEVMGSAFQKEGRRWHYYQESELSKLYLKENKVDIVLDVTGAHKKREELLKYFDYGIEKLIVCGSNNSVDVTIIPGINEEMYKPSKHSIIGASSCTAHGTSPVLKALDEKLTLSSIMLYYIHSFTNSQNLLDKEHLDVRRARSAIYNIIPTTTSSISEIPKVLPQFCDRLSGFAFRVPTPLVHGILILAYCEEQVDTIYLLDILGEFSQKNSHNNLMMMVEERLVSSDFIGNAYSSNIDIQYTYARDKLLQILCWHDNETAYSLRAYDLLRKLATEFR